MVLESLLMPGPWLVVMAIVAFVAVGCGTSAAQPMATRPEATAELSPAADPLQAPTAPTVTVDHGAGASVAIDPQPAPQSGQVRVSGKGFAAGESIGLSADQTSDANSETVSLASTVANADGSFDAVTLTLPDSLQSGGHPLDAVGQTSGATGTATLWIRAPQPWLVLDKYDIPQYGDLGFVAGGFEPMDRVDVTLEPAAGSNATRVSLVTLTTDQAGNADWSQLKLPRLSAGTYTMVVQGEADAAEVRRDLNVTPLKPLLELSPWAGPAGASVRVNAHGFAPNEPVQVSLGGAHDSTPLRADEYGNLWGAGPLHIPQSAATGGFAIDLAGGDSGATATAEFKVLDPKPWLELTSWSGAPGAPVSFGGGGWIGGEQVTIHIGSATSPAVTSEFADESGWLKGSDQVYVPNEVNDDVIFVAVGDKSHIAAAATFKVVFPFGLRPGQTDPRRAAAGG
jgi:hypothetical protein